MKKYKIIIPILCTFVVLAIAAALLAPGFFKNTFTDKPNNQTDTVFTLAQSKYTPMLTGTGADFPADLPPLQTDIANLFYTINPADGTVAFYDATATGLVPYTGTVMTAQVTVNCSNRDIPVTLTYLQQGEKITGYGLFTATPDNAAADIFPYAFFKLTALPTAYGKSGQLLLVDFDKENFWINDKLYTEAFIVDLNNPGAKPKNLTTDNSRTVDLTGAMRSDWVLFTDDFLAILGTKPYFLSSRDYNLDRKGLVSDILELAVKKPPRVVTGILGLWARAAGDGLKYLKTTDSGFDCLTFDGASEQVVKSFSGGYFEEYLQSGHHLLNKKTFVLTDLLTGAEKTLKDVPAGSVLSFSVSPDASRAVVAVPGGGEIPATAVQTLILYNLEADTAKTITEPLIFSPSNANFTWIDNNTLFHLRPSDEEATGLRYCIIKF